MHSKTLFQACLCTAEYVSGNQVRIGVNAVSSVSLHG